MTTVTKLVQSNTTAEIFVIEVSDKDPNVAEMSGPLDRSMQAAVRKHGLLGLLGLHRTWYAFHTFPVSVVVVKEKFQVLEVIES